MTGASIAHFCRAAILIVFASLVMMPAKSHEIVPSVADLTVHGDRVAIQIRTNLEALIAQVGPEHNDTEQSPNAQLYRNLRLQEPNALKGTFKEFEDTFTGGLSLVANGSVLPVRVDLVEVPPVGDPAVARTTRITISAPLPAAGETVTFAWAAEFGQMVIRAVNAQGDGYVTLLEPGQATDPISLAEITPPGWFDVLAEFIGNGYQHVLGLGAMGSVNLFGLEIPLPDGIDHMLFMVGLFLLTTRFAPLLWQITAFTLAHTVTLVLAVLGLVNISPAIIDPLIAALIVYVAIENLVTSSLNPGRLLVVFLFGLLHGLGFAGALGAFGLPESQLVPSLLGFNVGVELGQLTVLAICFLLVGIWFGGKSWYRNSVVIPGSSIVALIGAYWFVERTLL